LHREFRAIRLSIFVSLPLRSLDQLSLQNELREIGRLERCDGESGRIDVKSTLAQRVVAEALGIANAHSDAPQVW
jgi:hypothetical protein